MVGYAKCLMHGIGVAKDSKEAAIWIERAQRKKE
jgi:TPR repeat protein